MSDYTWEKTFTDLFRACAAKYRSGDTAFGSWFSDEEAAFLDSIGYTKQELFDYVEDHCHAEGGEPTMETALLVASVRRDYFTVVMNGERTGRIVDPADLPAKTLELEGIRWLPRILVKARAKLRGEMDADTMFGCGGDRAFLSEHGIHPADFLRRVWAAGDDDQAVLEFVKSKG
jgi:hypothetical protein